MTGARDPGGAGLPPWRGETYYGRRQLKPAPFLPAAVGAYVFLAGLSGASALLGALAQATRGREAAPMVRRARYLSLLAPTLGSALLVWDLHVPRRFLNMLRVAKRTSPMSIGTWILMGFSGCAGIAGAAQMVTDARPRWRWPRRAAAAAQLPAACAGAGLSTYTAALLAATSTPLWAAAPRATAVRFASSAVTSAAAALLLGEDGAGPRRALADVTAAALATELAAGAATGWRVRQAGIAAARTGRWDTAERVLATGLGAALPLGLLVASRLSRRRLAGLEAAAAVAALAGSAALRISVLGAGIDSASRPEISLRFAQPDNLPPP